MEAPENNHSDSYIIEEEKKDFGEEEEVVEDINDLVKSRKE